MEGENLPLFSRLNLPKGYLTESSQVILIYEASINEKANPATEFLKTATEESEHSMQNYIEVIPNGGPQTQADYESLRYEKEAKAAAEQAGKESDAKNPPPNATPPNTTPSKQ